MLEALDHPFLFLFFLTFAVFAMAKVIAYLAGKAGLDTVSNFFVPQKG